MCLYVLREKCTGVQKNSAFGALCEASGAFHICGANISGRRYFVRWAEMNFMEKGPAEKQVLFLVELMNPKMNPHFLQSFQWLPTIALRQYSRAYRRN